MIAIDGFIIDVATAEEPAYEAEATEYPVESGADISDHIRNLGVSLSLEFVVSDTPVGEVAKARSDATIPSSEAKGFLLALRDSKRLFTVECASGVFEDMFFESLAFPRDTETGAALMGTATVKRIEVREVRRTIVGVKNLGKRAAKAITGKSFWLCPAGTREAIADDEFNAKQGCRRVLFKNGVPYFEDTGEQLTVGEVAQLNGQTADDYETKLRFDPNTGEWYTSKPEFASKDARARRTPARGPLDGILIPETGTTNTPTVPDSPFGTGANLGGGRNF